MTGINCKEYTLKNRTTGESFVMNVDIGSVYIKSNSHAESLIGVEYGDDSFDPYEALGIPKVIDLKQLMVVPYDRMGNLALKFLKKRSTAAEAQFKLLPGYVDEQVNSSDEAPLDSIIGIINSITTKAIFNDSSKLFYFNLESLGYTKDETTFTASGSKNHVADQIIDEARKWQDKIKIDTFVLKSRVTREEDLPEVIPSKPKRASTHEEDFLELSKRPDRSVRYNAKALSTDQSEPTDGRCGYQPSIAVDEFLRRFSDDK